MDPNIVVFQRLNMCIIPKCAKNSYLLNRDKYTKTISYLKMWETKA